MRQEFLRFYPCELGLFGKALTETVLPEMENLTLDIRTSRRQGMMELLQFLVISMVFQHIYLDSMKAQYALIVSEMSRNKRTFNFSEPRQKMIDHSRLPEAKIEKCLPHKMG